jgi:hypothetical protein
VLEIGESLKPSRSSFSRHGAHERIPGARTLDSGSILCCSSISQNRS